MRSEMMCDEHRGWGHPGWERRFMRHRKGERAEGGHGGHHHGHRGGHGRHEDFGGRRGGGGRFFDHGELRHVVLALLGEQPRHGYDIIRAVEDRTGGAYSPSPGVIYPTLQLLEDLGHAKPAAPSGERNSYEITAEGRAFLDERGALIQDIMARMKQAAQRNAGRSPVIVAAMDDLKSALRSGAGTWSEVELREIAAAILAAGTRIRRLRDSADDAASAKPAKE